MKIIHCGDLHLDSKLESNLPTAKSRERKKEIIMAFNRMVDYAAEVQATAVIIAGDLFDTDRMLPTTRDIVLGKIAECKDTEFLYLCGNHDAGKALAECELPRNLKLFGENWTAFEFGNVVVTGVELNEENCRHIYGGLRLDTQRFNIVTMHGQLDSASGVDKVNRNELADKGIDYLALGHYHTYRMGELGKNGVWCYCGCLEGRGFDECGDKGFVELDIAEDNTFEVQFVKNSMRDIVEVECDITSVSDTAVMLSKIDDATANVSAEAMLKLVLVGKLSEDARKDIELFKKHLQEKFWFVKIKDKTRIELRYEDYVNDVSLKGEFIRKALSSDLPEDAKNRIIECGLAALSGQEVL